MGTPRKRAADGKAVGPSKRLRVANDRNARALGENEHEDARLGSPQPRHYQDEHSVADTATNTKSTSRRPKRYVCDFEGCDKAFDRPVRLQAHQRTHTGDRPFVCEEPDCPKSFFKAEHLKAHISNKHGNDASHVCTYVVHVGDEGEEFQCGKAFTTATRLRRHLAAHEQKESLRCQEIGCGKVFRKIETLQRHVKQDHLHEKAFRCSEIVFEGETDMPAECGQEFATIGQLKAHENRVHTGLKHFCEICSPPNSANDERAGEAELDIMDELSRVGFATYGEYQHHMKAAHPPTCETCGQACESRRALAAHKDIEHSTLNERQKFPCTHPDCGRSFTRPGNLKVHIQNVHVKHKKFICGQFDLSTNDKCPDWDGHGCGMAFGTKANLENHTRTQHLALPSLLKRRAVVKDEGSPAATGSSMEVDEPVELDAMFGSSADQQGAIALLTGYGYAQSRPIACWTPGCPLRFTRTCDLAQHMELKHGWLVDDINDRFAEEEALSGGQFWIGGEDDADSHVKRPQESLETVSADQQTPKDLLTWDAGECAVVDDDAPHIDGILSDALGKSTHFEEGFAMLEADDQVAALDPALRRLVEAA